MTWYNENDRFAAAWLQKLQDNGHISRGTIDIRSIEEVQPNDVPDTAHFFAGIGVWDLALRLAGFPADRSVWTGSCPCQPFSAAGKRGGFNDSRHLWPAWLRLIRERHPVTIFGEQVSSNDGLRWFDHVATDLEAEGYTVGALDTCAASVGAPHIRQRLYFVADSRSGHRTERRNVADPTRGDQGAEEERQRLLSDVGDGGDAGGLADTKPSERWPISQEHECHRTEPDRETSSGTWTCGEDGFVGDSHEARPQGRSQRPDPSPRERSPWSAGTTRAVGNPESPDGQVPVQQRGSLQASPELGRPSGPPPWSDAYWLQCRDGNPRPVPTEPSLFPLAPTRSVRNRVGTLRGAGNALCAPQATAFIKAFLDSESNTP